MSDYWNSLYDSFDAFAAAVNPLAGPMSSIAGYVWSRDRLILEAWHNPFSTVGAYVRGLLALGQPASAQVGDWGNAWAGMGDWGVAGSAGGTWDWSGGTMTLVISNVYRCSVNAVQGTRNIVNVFGLRGSAAGQEAAACAALQTAWKVSAGPLTRLRTEYTLQYFEAVDLSSTSGGIFRITDTTAGGLSTGSISTNAASALLKWNGNTRSKTSRGRTYFGPLDEASINTDGRTLASASKTAIGSAFTNFRSSLATSGFTLCVISRKEGASHDVTLQTVEDVIATQRRRIRS